MYEYMEYIQRSFYRSTGWNEDNSYESITATSQALIEFTNQQDVKLNIASKSSDHTVSQLTLSNSGVINGSIAYLYTSVPLQYALGTSEMSLQDAIAGYRTIRPPLQSPLNPSTNVNSAEAAAPHSLYYGRMYFPGSALEAMVIKRISKISQLMVKCVSNSRLKHNGTMTFFLQRDTGKLSTEYVFSTNEALLGFRFLYSLRQGAERLNTALYNNSSLSFGGEVWYGALNMSPGLSTALRYSTKSTYTGKPLTMTLACNPILGHISSTYSVRTSVNSTFSSRYDFNIYSYDSDLSFGCELWKTGDSPKGQGSPSVSYDSEDQGAIDSFERVVKDTAFSSVVKAATTLNNKDLKLLWEGKYKKFIVSAGVDLQLLSNSPDVKKCGLQIQYAA